MGTRDMNKWMNRAVAGTVGIAGGVLLLGAGAAHADSVVPTTGTLDDVFRPAPADNLGLSLDTPGSTVSTGMVDEGPLSVQRNDGLTGAVVHTPGENGQSRDVFATGRLPDPLSALPSNDLMPGSALGVPQPGASEGKHRAAAAPGLPVLGTLSSLPLPGNLPVVGNATKAVPSLGSAGQPEALPLVGGVPQLVDGNLPALTGQGLPAVPGLPVRGTVKPVNDMAIPLGQPGSATESGTESGTSICRSSGTSWKTTRSAASRSSTSSPISRGTRRRPRACPP